MKLTIQQRGFKLPLILLVGMLLFTCGRWADASPYFVTYTKNYAVLFNGSAVNLLTVVFPDGGYLTVLPGQTFKISDPIDLVDNPTVFVQQPGTYDLFYSFPMSGYPNTSEFVSINDYPYPDAGGSCSEEILANVDYSPDPVVLPASPPEPDLTTPFVAGFGSGLMLVGFAWKMRLLKNLVISTD